MLLLRIHCHVLCVILTVKSAVMVRHLDAISVILLQFLALGVLVADLCIFMKILMQVCVHHETLPEIVALVVLLVIEIRAILMQQ
jgi:hypothetical protein